MSDDRRSDAEYDERRKRHAAATSTEPSSSWLDLSGLFGQGDEGEKAEKREHEQFNELDRAYKAGRTSTWISTDWYRYVDGVRAQYEDRIKELYPREQPVTGKRMSTADFQLIEKYRGLLYEVKNALAATDKPTNPQEQQKRDGLKRIARNVEDIDKKIKDLELPYFRSMEVSSQTQYDDARKKIQQYNKNIDLLKRYKNYFTYTIERLHPNSPLRRQMENSLRYVTKQIETLQKQNVAEAAKAHAAKKQEIAANQQQKQQQQKEQGKEKATEDNKAKTTETPNKPAATPEAKKDPDEELNNIMTMMANLNKMQDAGADQFHVNWVAQVLARRMAAYSGNTMPGMSDAQYSMLPPHMRTPFGAMVNRASYEQSLRKKTEDYYENSHLPRPNWLQNLDKLDQSTQIDLLRQMSPALVPDAKSLPGPSRSSWGGMDYKGFSIPKSDSNTISDTPQLKAPSGSSNLSMEEDESRQMGYNPYGTSYPNLGNLSPGMDMSNMLGDNYLMNQMMSRQGVPPYPMA